MSQEEMISLQATEQSMTATALYTHTAHTYRRSNKTGEIAQAAPLDPAGVDVSIVQTAGFRMLVKGVSGDDPEEAVRKRIQEQAPIIHKLAQWDAGQKKRLERVVSRHNKIVQFVKASTTTELKDEEVLYPTGQMEDVEKRQQKIKEIKESTFTDVYRHRAELIHAENADPTMQDTAIAQEFEGGRNVSKAGGEYKKNKISSDIASSSRDRRPSSAASSSDSRSLLESMPLLGGQSIPTLGKPKKGSRNQFMSMNAYQLHLDERQRRSKNEQNERNLRKLQQAVPKTVKVKLTPSSMGSGTKWAPSESGWIPSLRPRPGLNELLDEMRDSACGDREPVTIDPDDL